MKIRLEKLPQLQDLERAYEDLFRSRQPELHLLDLNLFALYAQWSRFDSRLGEICVSHLLESWEQINPIEIRAAFLRQPWPGILGVFLEFCRQKLKKDESGDQMMLFKNWKATATTGIRPVHWEQFFIGKRRMAGSAMMNDVRFSLQEYKRWGYLSREHLIPHKISPSNSRKKLDKTSGVSESEVLTSSSSPPISYSSATRRQILKDLLDAYPRMTTELYWTSVSHSISRRQAERDLADCEFLRPVGKTKGKYFVRR